MAKPKSAPAVRRKTDPLQVKHCAIGDVIKLADGRTIKRGPVLVGCAFSRLVNEAGQQTELAMVDLDALVDEVLSTATEQYRGGSSDETDPLKAGNE